MLENDHQNRGIVRFAEWVEANQSRFKARVYGPLLCEVTAKDMQHAKYLEMQISREP
jgi:hypothetical protein